MRNPFLVIILCFALGCSRGSLPTPSDQIAPVAGPSGASPGVPHAPEESSQDRPPSQPVSWSASNTSAADLRKTADDPRADRASRAAAVFALFANYMKPRCSATKAGEALGDAKWLTHSDLNQLPGIAGLIPVDFGGDGTVYCLYLFSDRDGGSDWVIYLRLSGRDHTEDDLRTFLRGGNGLKANVELLQFALCYPGKQRTLELGRTERFGPDGLVLWGD